MKWYLVVIIYISLMTNDVEHLFMYLLLIYSLVKNIQAFPGSLAVRNLPANSGDSGDTVRSLGQEDSLKKEMATHSSILAWKIPSTEEPGGLQSIALQRVGHDGEQLITHTCKGMKRAKMIHGHRLHDHGWYSVLRKTVTED